MQVSELVAALQRVQQVAGDVPVVLRNLEDDAETELRSLGLHIGPTAESDASSVELEHAAPSPAVNVDPEPAAPPAV